MGSSIAAHFANAGCKVNLLDIVDKINMIFKVDFKRDEESEGL